MGYLKKKDDFLRKVFEHYGRLISRNPASAIVFAILLNCLLGLNIFWISSEDDMDTLYMPTNSQASRDQAKVKDMFPDSTGTNFYYQNLPNLGYYGSLIVKVPDNILDRKYKAEVEDIFNVVLNITVKDDTKEANDFRYDDLCARRDGECFIQGNVYLSDTFLDQVENREIPFPKYVDPKYGINYLQFIFGDPNVENGTLISSQYLKLMFHLRQDTDEFVILAKKWEREFVEVMKAYTSNLTEVAYGYFDSLSSELDSNTGGDIALFSLTFTLMITYASFATIGGDFLTQRGHLGRTGVLTAALAILGAFGISSAVGIKFVNMVGIMPFLILGIGLDDMFILLSGLADAPIDGTVEERIVHTMGTSGVAITITSLTDMTAFFAGALSVFMSVRNFCLYSGIAVIMCYVNQITFFMGCMVFHEKRIAARRHCITCTPVFTRKEMKQVGITNQCVLCCFSGEPAESRDDVLSPCEKLPAKLLPRMILNIPAKIIISILFVIYLIVSVWGSVHLEQGLDLSNLMAEDSYYYQFSVWDNTHFPMRIPTSINIRNLNISNPTELQDLNNLLQSVRDDKDISNLTIDWLDFYKTSGIYDETDASSFSVENIKKFLEYAPIFQNDIVFDSTGEILKSTRFHYFTRDMKSSHDQGKYMLRIRETVDASPLDAFAFSPAFIYFEQYVEVLPNTLQTVGIAVLTVFVITCIFIPNFMLILLITLSMVSITLGVIGFMQIWGLSLSSITMIHLIMCVGFSVDFSAHICHAFISTEGTDRQARTNSALVRAGSPIANCAFTSILGICTLIFSKSYVFQSFFKVIFLVTIFGFLHAVLVLPVILSVIGPAHPDERSRPRTVLSAPGIGNRLNGLSNINKGFVGDVMTKK